MTVLADEPRFAWATRYALAADARGALYLASSRDRGAHTVARLRVDARGASVTGIAFGAGAVMQDQARASEWGVTVATVFDRDRPNVVGYRNRDFLRVGEREWRARCF